MIAATASAQQNAVLMDSQLMRHHVRLVGLSVSDGGGSVRFFDDQRRLTDAPVGGYLSLRFVEAQSQDQPAELDDEPLALWDRDAAGGAAAQALDPAALEPANQAADVIREIRVNGGGVIQVRGNVQLRMIVNGREVVLNGDRVLRPQGNAAPAGPAVPADAANPAAEDDAPLPIGQILLADGQRYTGRLLGVGEQGRIRFLHDALGELSFDLDRVAAMTRDGKLDHQPVDTDVVHLANGDRVAGFVEAMDAKTLMLQADNRSLPIAWSAIRAIHLANPIVRPRATWLLLKDESRLLMRQVDLAGTQLTGVTADDRSVTLPLDAVTGVDFAAAQQLIDVGELKGVVTEGGEVFGVPFEPMVRPQRIELHAPLTWRFDLPAGSQRFAAAVQIPLEARDRADLTLIIADERGPLATHHLNAAAPTVDVNLPLRGRTLLLKLEPGLNGPLMDRLVLTDVVVLVK